MKFFITRILKLNRAFQSPKAIIYLFSLILVLSFEICSAQEQRINLAVAEFEARNVSQMDALAVSDFVRTELVRTRLFKVLDRTNMSMILEEQAFQMTGCTTQECAVKMGELLNVQKIVIGILTKLADVYFVTISIIDVETGEIQFSEREKSPEAGDLPESAEKLARIISSKLTGKEPEEAYAPSTRQRPYISEVISVKKAKINLGIFDGVKKRYLYDIFSDSEKIGKLRVKSVGPEESICQIVKLNKDEKAVRGLSILRKGKWRAGGIGIMGGDITGELGSGQGGGFYYDSIFKSGWGFQFLLSSYYMENYESGYFYYDTISVTFITPLIIKYHIGWYNTISPYIGLGLCIANYYYDSENDIIKAVPVLNLGINFFATSFFQLVFDVKHFASKKEWYGYDTAATAFSLGLSLNW